MMASASTLVLPPAGVRALARPVTRRPAVAVRAASTRLPPPGSQPAPKSKDMPGSVGDIISIATTLGLTGASIGTYMDGIHSRVQVLVYDKLPLVHGGLHTSAVVPPLLAGK